MLILWLGFSSVFVLLFIILLSNDANLSQAPGFKARLKIFLTTHQAEVQQTPVLPELTSPTFDLPPSALFEKLPAIINDLGWVIKLNDPDNNLLEAVVSSSLFGFKDDVDISVLANENGSYIYANSRSRVGRADFAANSHHLQQLLERLENSKKAW